MSNNNGVTAIAQKFLDTGDLFALKFNEGFVFLEVTGWEQVKYAPHTQIGEVTADDSSGFQRLEAPDGDDILYVEKEKNKVVHAGIGHSPSQVRRYSNYPDSANRLRRVPNLSTPTSGDDFGYVDGDDSPYSNPTDAEELYIPPGTHLDFDFYNDDTDPHEIVVKILMRVYNVRPLDSNKSRNQGAIKKVMSPGSPIPIGFVGTPDNQDTYELGRSWGVEPLTRKEINRRVF
jgi:hypothetical protein